MDFSVLVAGLGLGFSLIIAIGAQNVFVLRQGIRREHVFATKLLDVPLYVAATAAAGAPHAGAYAYSDTDVLFTRPTRGLDRRAAGDRVLLMRDVCNTIPIAFYDRYLARHRLPLAERANAGFMFVGAGAFDLDFFEAFLREPAYRGQRGGSADWFVEQTAWTMRLPEA